MIVEGRFQGLEGMGQGGYLGGLIAETRTGPIEVSYRSPIPLDVPLSLRGNSAEVEIVASDVLIATARSANLHGPFPSAVSAEVAERARSYSESEEMFVTTCFSCGTTPGGFRIHPGPVNGDGSAYATPFRPPAWTAPEGFVQLRYLWAPLDCAAGWRVSAGGERMAVTGALSVEQLRPIEPERVYVIVADALEPWQGRKRRAASALYTADGELVARSDSLWILTSTR